VSARPPARKDSQISPQGEIVKDAKASHEAMRAGAEKGLLEKLRPRYPDRNWRMIPLDGAEDQVDAEDDGG
jgi:hypothetical protein